MQRRLTQPVERNEIIPIQTLDTRFTAIDPLTGEPLFFVFVDNTSNSKGTFESPYPTMALAEANSKKGDVIYVFPGDGTSTGYDTGFLMKQRQLLQSSSQPFVRGPVTIPPATPGGVRPILTNTAGDALTLAGKTQVSGFTFSNASNDGINASSAGKYDVFNNIITNNAMNGFESTSAPRGAKVISGNQFIANNTSLSAGVAEILLAIEPGNNFDILENTINAGNQSAFGVDATTKENASLLISGNSISNYLAGGLGGGGANIVSTATGSQTSEIFLTRNTLLGPGVGFTGAYTIVCSTGQNNVEINGNGISNHGFFHTIVNVLGGRTILQTNDNTYADPNFIGQITISGVAAQLCHECTGNISTATRGLDFRNTGASSTYQIESSDAAMSGVAAANPDVTSIFYIGSFDFVLPGTPCP